MGQLQAPRKVPGVPGLNLGALGRGDMPPPAPPRGPSGDVGWAGLKARFGNARAHLLVDDRRSCARVEDEGAPDMAVGLYA